MCVQEIRRISRTTQTLEGLPRGEFIQGVSQGINENKKKTAIKMLKIGKLSMEEIAEYTELSIAEVEQLAGYETKQKELRKKNRKKWKRNGKSHPVSRNGRRFIATIIKI